MGKKFKMSQREISRAGADKDAASPSPETTLILPPSTRLQLELLFGKRNEPGIPPHIQREKLPKEDPAAQAKSPLPAPPRSSALPAAITQYQAKPRGRSHHATNFRFA
jgi:hypothetical protein